MATSTTTTPGAAVDQTIQGMQDMLAQNARLTTATTGTNMMMKAQEQVVQASSKVVQGSQLR